MVCTSCVVLLLFYKFENHGEDFMAFPDIFVNGLVALDKVVGKKEKFLFLIIEIFFMMLIVQKT